MHTTVQLSTSLAYSYVRSTVTIWGNVVAATQGATQQDVLGSGSASQAGQSFPLSRSPLTYLPAPTAAGAASTLDHLRQRGVLAGSRQPGLGRARPTTCT